MAMDEQNVGDTPVWQLYVTPPEAWGAMLHACEGALTSIECEQYIFEPDEIGERFVHVLIKKAREGLRVRLLCDGIGSYALANSSIPKRLKEAGVQVRFYNRFYLYKAYKLVSWFLRDHCKVLVIDSTTIFTGGVGISKAMQSWRDTHLKIQGELGRDVRASFEAMWKIAGHPRFLHLPKSALLKGNFGLIGNSPRLNRRYIYHSLLRGIKESKASVYLATAYFVPSLRLTHALTKASKRGIDVRIMLPHTSDVRIVDTAARSYITHLLTSGVKIYRYQGTVFHAKTAVIDYAWASVGSANLDNLSLLLNYEANIFSTNTEFIQKMREQFDIDIAHSDQIDLKQWSTRPFFEKFTELLTWPLHWIL